MQHQGDELLARDKKKLSMSGWAALPPFLVSAATVPVYLGVVVPGTLMYNGFKAVKKALGFSRKHKATPPPSLSDLPETGVPPLDSRPYDLVLFGATGFTGRIAARYLATHYAGKVRFALAGRRKSELEAVRDELATLNPDPSIKQLPLIVADSSDARTLASMVTQCRAVISTVGPYMRYGIPLVALCAKAGTSYADITGEPDFVRYSIEQLDDTARSTGARIVHFCGHDCVPWDLLVMRLANQMREKHGQELQSVRVYNDIMAAISGGTTETIYDAASRRSSQQAGKPYDPLVRVWGEAQHRAEPSQCKLTNKSGFMLKWDKTIGSVTGASLMAMVNGLCIKRSNALLHYSPRLTYTESANYPGFMAGFVQSYFLTLILTSTQFPPLRYLLRKVLPKPGQGPSEKQQTDGFLRVRAVARGSQGAEETGMVYFPLDPGYRETARMIVESGLCLALDAKQLRVGGGVFTPASCMGDALVSRLRETGTVWA